MILSYFLLFTLSICSNPFPLAFRSKNQFSFKFGAKSSPICKCFHYKHFLIENKQFDTSWVYPTKLIMSKGWVHVNFVFLPLLCRMLKDSKNMILVCILLIKLYIKFTDKVMAAFKSNKIQILQTRDQVINGCHPLFITMGNIIVSRDCWKRRFLTKLIQKIVFMKAPGKAKLLTRHCSVSGWDASFKARNNLRYLGHSI